MKIRHFIYQKLIPKTIKKHIDNQYYRDFIQLAPPERRNKLKNLNYLNYKILEYYCYIYCLLYVFFDVENIQEKQIITDIKK